ncbi:hypothetical protein C2845_PM07G19760 [Panicum miliaceum]|uniref:Uncharacterized protein n=1 Tax=Panicum miliaceum TaxID=4540 RepID=A0A3L6SHU5_PANMI|nr:hypothetical protein C2845_PM07G19760 [Panicum miliaceum]
MAGGARDGGGEDGKTTTATAKVPSLLVMFRYADRGDVALMAVGTVAAVANGMSEPLMTVVFAAVIECFGAGDDSTVLHRISKDKPSPLFERKKRKSLCTIAAYVSLACGLCV